MICITLTRKFWVLATPSDWTLACTTYLNIAEDKHTHLTKVPNANGFPQQDNVLHRTAHVVSNGLKENHKDPKMEID